MNKLLSYFQIKFKDRQSAASMLARILEWKITLEERANTVIIGVPRAGILTADVVAQRLNAPSFKIIVPRKISVPENREHAIGAIMGDWTTYMCDDPLSWVSKDYLETEKLRQVMEIKDRIRLYHHYSTIESNICFLKKKTVVLIDDGVATGATLLVTLSWIKKKLDQQTSIKRLIVASPIVTRRAASLLASQCDEVVSVIYPSKFYSVEQFYKDFREVSHEEVVSILKRRVPRQDFNEWL